MKIFWLILIVVSFYLIPVTGQNNGGKRELRIGIIADVHGSEDRLQAFVDKAANEKLDFIIQLGDLSNGTTEETEGMLAVWNSYPGRKYHVLGNHEMDYATKDDIVRLQEMPEAYYSFDCGDYHFVVLDCNYIKKDNEYINFGKANYYIKSDFRDLINPEQVKWLKGDIEKTSKQVIIFSHQSFDDISIKGANPVPNRMKVRNLIDSINRSYGPSRKVIACFAGHDHLDHYNQIDGVHFFAVNSAYGFKKSLELEDGIYAFVTLNNNDRTITIQGTTTCFKKSPTDEDYGGYPKEAIFPYISNRKVFY